MANKETGFQSSGNSRSRALIFFFVIVAIIASLYVYFVHIRDTSSLPIKSGASSVSRVSGSAGADSASPEFVKLLSQENTVRANRAKEEGRSAIATVVRPSFRGTGEFEQAGNTKKGCSPAELKRARAAGVTAFELRCRGCSAAALRAAGYTAAELKSAGFSAQQLRDAGFSAEELRDAGFTAKELRDAGFTVTDLVKAGYTAKELYDAGFTEDELIFAGLTKQQLAEAGIGLAEAANMPTDCNPESLRKARAAGIKAVQLRELGCGAAALRAAGFTAKELKDAGFTANELRAAGFSAAELKDAGFTAAELMAAGFTAKELKDAGFTIAQLRDAGVTAEQLVAAGFTREELLAAGFSEGELLRAGLEPEVKVVKQQVGLCDPEFILKLKERKVSPLVFRKLGCSDEQLLAAGFTPAEILKIATATERPIVAVTEVDNIRKNREAALSEGQRQEEIEKLQDAMRGTASSLFGTWTPPPSQVFVVADEEVVLNGATAANGNTAPAATGALGPDGKPLFKGPSFPVKAGNILFGVLNTGVNSDEESPILATIVSGKLKGAKLVGKFTTANKKVVLQFNIMSLPWFDTSIPVNVFAIDPNTARTALASEVDNHYLMRFGGLFASSFLSGIAEAVTSSGSEVAATTAGVVSTAPQLTTSEKFLVALGKVGTEYANILGENFKRKPTVTVASGSSVGLLFQADAQIPLPNNKDELDD